MLLFFFSRVVLHGKSTCSCSEGTSANLLSANAWWDMDIGRIC